MDCLTLIQKARDGGLTLRIDGDQLVVRGPKRCADLAGQLIARKTEVVASLRSANDASADQEWIDASSLPACTKCGSLELWQSPMEVAMPKV